MATIDNNILELGGVIQLRGGTAEAMTTANPLLARREIAVELDTGRIKCGDGVHSWNELPYSGLTSPPNDGRAYVMRNGVWETVPETVTESHTLTANEVKEQGFRLKYSVAAGHEDNVLLFASGVAQAAGVDFTASGKVISWAEQGLANVGNLSGVELKAGETFLIQYKKGD